MAMNLSEKIDFLMKLTGTRNAALGRALHFDASYISRIRSGKRGLPSHAPFIEPVSLYFARAVKEDYQKSAAARVLELDRPWPEDDTEAAALLAAWLDGGMPVRDTVERIIETMAAPAADADPVIPDGRRAEVSLFFGNEGKRNAVLRFLTGLCTDGGPHTLLLHSDEDMAWLYEDPVFARTWSTLLEQIIDAGGRIRIIHSISRNVNEMWEAVRKWLPLYLSGAIEAYYYPRLRDGIYRRTLFVAEGRAAVLSDAVTGQTGATVNILLTEPAAVQALEREFAAYLALCRPLMEVARPDGPKGLAALLRAFLDTPGDPLAVFSGDVIICLKERFGALVVKPAQPCTVFRLREPRMVAAMEEYLRNLPGGPCPEPALAALEGYIASLEE